jgi:hypothetical protein
MGRNANTAFLATLLLSLSLAGGFGYEAYQFRRNQIASTELPSALHSATVPEIEAYLEERLADALGRANTIAALEAAIRRQDSERIAELQESLISQFGETAEGARKLSLEQASQNAIHAEQLLQEFQGNKVILERYIGVSLGSLALALVLIAWSVSRGTKGISSKTCLAAISGFLAWFYFLGPLGLSTGWPLTPGMFFAAGVLFPYLAEGSLAWLRALGLVVVATISFWLAFQLALKLATWDIGPSIGLLAYICASLVGAAVVVSGARFIVPLRRTLELALAGLVAAIVGGIAFKLAESLLYPAFIIWHSLMAVAIHVAENWQLRSGKIE